MKPLKISISCKNVSDEENLIFQQDFFLPEQSSTYIDLFNELKNKDFLTRFNEENAVLVLKAENYPCIFSYYTKSKQFSEGLVEKRLKIFSKEGFFTLQYYSSVQKWKETFYKWYDNNEYYLWRDGWTNEIAYCNELIE